MGRYYDDRVSVAGLDPANPFFSPIKQAALAINNAEEDFYEDRRDLFKELNGNNSVGNKDRVEAEYARLHTGLDVYDFKSTFNRANPSRRSGGGNDYRYVYAPWELTTFEAGFADDVYELGEEDDDGDSQYELAEDVLNYHEGRGKVGIDTLYQDVRAFTTGRRKSGYFERVDDDDDGYRYDSITVYEGFGEVPLAWERTGSYSSHDLQVMNAAGTAYEEDVRPKINEYRFRLIDYEANGGGPLVFDFYEGTADFPYEGYTGESTTYNRPRNLSAALIDQARGFS